MYVISGVQMQGQIRSVTLPDIWNVLRKFDVSKSIKLSSLPSE